MQLLRGKEIAVNVLRPSFQVWGCGPVFGRPVSFYLRNSFVLQRKIVKVFCLIFFALQAKGLRGINETYKFSADPNAGDSGNYRTDFAISFVFPLRISAGVDD